MDFFVLILSISLCAAPMAATYASYASLYEDGVRSYLQGRWYECAALTKQALDRQREYKETVLQCRLLCHGAGIPPDMDVQSVPV